MLAAEVQRSARRAVELSSYGRCARDRDATLDEPEAVEHSAMFRIAFGADVYDLVETIGFGDGGDDEVGVQDVGLACRIGRGLAVPAVVPAAAHLLEVFVGTGVIAQVCCTPRHEVE